MFAPDPIQIFLLQPRFQKSWDAVQNVNNSRMQWFANLISAVRYSQRNTENVADV